MHVLTDYFVSVEFLLQTEIIKSVLAFYSARAHSYIQLSTFMLLPETAREWKLSAIGIMEDSLKSSNNPTVISPVDVNTMQL